MFEKRTIYNRVVIDFWNSLGSETNEKCLKNQFFQFNKSKYETIILLKNEKWTLSPKIDFIQARIHSNSDGREIIIVEPKYFISILYKGLIIFWVSFVVLLNIGLIATIIFTIIFSLIMKYNYDKINNGILEYENILESHSQLQE